MPARCVTSNYSFVPYRIDAADATRSTLAVTDRAGCLRLVDGETLEVRCAWQLGDDATGAHAVRAADQAALVSGVGR